MSKTKASIVMEIQQQANKSNIELVMRRLADRIVSGQLGLVQYHIPNQLTVYMDVTDQIKVDDNNANKD